MVALVHLQTQQALEAAGYVRVSRKAQADGHSPELQREAIKHLAAHEGYALTMIEEDHERGSRVDREGYQRIIEAVRSGSIQTVIVYMFDRWGRDGAEWLTRAREFERMGVSIVSVQEGRDEGGIMRFVRAGMAEEYSRQLAKRVMPARQKAASEGTFMGPTPLGYKRVYPAYESNTKKPAGQLVKDEATAWIVQELFTRYAAGGWSIRKLAEWMNADPRVREPRNPKCPAWTNAAIKALLHNPVYLGMVRYNHRPMGHYCRAKKEDYMVVPGKHEALIDTETFERVQRRMAESAKRPTYNRHADEPILAAGLMYCNGCGGPMRSSRKGPDLTPYYECGWRTTGRPDAAGHLCKTRSYLGSVAHEALLREVSRLRGAPWTPQRELSLTGEGREDAERIAELERDLHGANERLRQNTVLMSQMVDDATPEQMATFRQISAEISAEIREIEAQLTESREQATRLPQLRDLHAKLAETEIGTILMALGERGDIEGQRELIQEVVASARVAERKPESHPKWVRVDVVWTPDVQLLLDADLLHLDPVPEAPTFPTSEELERAAWKRYREAHREQRNEARRLLRARRKLEREQTGAAVMTLPDAEEYVA